MQIDGERRKAAFTDHRIIGKEPECFGRGPASIEAQFDVSPDSDHLGRFDLSLGGFSFTKYCQLFFTDAQLLPMIDRR